MTVILGDDKEKKRPRPYMPPGMLNPDQGAGASGGSPTLPPRQAERTSEPEKTEKKSPLQPKPEKKPEKKPDLAPPKEEKSTTTSEAPEVPSGKGRQGTTVSSPYGVIRKPTPEEAERHEARRQQKLAAGYPLAVDQFIWAHKEAWDTNPDEMASKLQIAHKSGISPVFLDDPVMRKEAAARAQMRDDLARYGGVSERTLQWLDEGYNMRIARDDAPELEAVYKSLNRLAIAFAPDQVWSTGKALRGGVADTLRGSANANLMEAEAPEKEPVKRPYMPPGMMNPEQEVQVPTYSARLSGMSLEEYKAYEQGLYRENKKAWAQTYANWAAGIDPGAYLMPTTTGGRLWHDVVRSSPYTVKSMAETLAINALLGPGVGSVAAAMYSAGSESRLQAGNLYAEARARGLSPDEAYERANQVAAANMALLFASDYLQNLLTFGAARGSSGLLSGAMRGSRGYGAAAWVGEKLLSSGFEGLEEVGQDVIDALVMGDALDYDALRWSFVVGAASGSIYSFGGGGINALASKVMSRTEADMKIARAQENTAVIDGVLDAIGATKTVQRMPEALENFVEEVTGGQLGTLYIDGGKFAEFFQLADEASIDEMIRDLGIEDEYQAAFAEQLKEAITNGTDVEIDAAKFLTRIATNEQYRGIKEHIRLADWEMSEYEAKAAEEARVQEVARMLEEMEAEKEKLKEAGSAGAALFKGLKEEMKATDRTDIFGKKGGNADLYISLLTARLIRKASDLGMDPADLAKPGALRIVGEGSDVRVEVRKAAQSDSKGSASGVSEAAPESRARPFRKEPDTSSGFPEAASRGSAANRPADEVSSISESGTNASVRGQSDAAGEVYNQNDNASVVKVSGKEFGSEFDLTTPEGQKKFRDVAIEFYRKNVQEKTIDHPDPRIGKVLFSRRGLGKAISSSGNVEKLKLFAKLPEIVKTARVVGNPEPVKNKEKHPNVKQYWWLEANVEVGDKRYIVGFSLEEHSDGKIYYNHLLMDPSKREGPSSGSISGVAQESRTLPPSEEGPNTISISESGENASVNTQRDGINLELQQVEPRGEKAQASIAFTDIGAIVQLFEGADKSSPLHEFGHFFLKDLWETASAEGIAESVRADWAALSQWLGIEDIDLGTGVELSEADAKRLQDGHEKFAVAFEKYLMEGKAPSSELARAFRAFKRWLIAIYKTVQNLMYRDSEGNRVAFELNDDVRKIMDRMLATDEAIEHEAVMNDLLSTTEIFERERVTEEIDPEAFAVLDDEQYEMIEAAKERLLAEMLDEVTPEREAKLRARADEVRGEIRSLVEREPVYRAISEMQANPALRLSSDELADGWGDAFVANLPEGIDAPDGIPVEAAAASYGFASTDEFVKNLAEAVPLEAEVERRAMEFATREDGQLSGDRLRERAKEALHEGDETISTLITEAELLRDRYAGLWEMVERAEAERDNPLSRGEIVKVIKEQGKLNYRKVKEGYGIFEAQELMKRTGSSLWARAGEGMGLDEMAQVLESLGVPVRGDGHLFEILMSEDETTLSPLDEAYQKGVLDARAKDREKRKQVWADNRERKEWLLQHNEKLRSLKDVIRDAADAVIGAKEAGDAVNPRPYYIAENRARKEAEGAMRKKDWAAAAAAKDREILNHACARAAIRAKREESRIMQHLRKIANRPNKQTFDMTPSSLAQADALLERFDLRNRLSQAERDKSVPVKSLRKFVEEMQAAGEPVMIPESMLDANFRKHYTKLTLNELRDLDDAVKNIERLGKYDNRFIRNRRIRNINTAAQMIADRMTNYFKLKGPSDMDPAELREAKGLLEKLRDAPTEFFASLEMVEYLCRAMDGYEDLGTAHQYIFQPIRTALSAETELLNEKFGELNRLAKSIYGTDKPGFAQEKISFDIPMRDVNGNISRSGKKWELTKDQVIAAVLNMGNEGNLQRLTDGWMLGEKECRMLVDSLSEKDLQFVQGIWDLFESLRPLVKETSELMTGITPRWVEAKPLQTQYGVLRGGYYPIVTDTRYSERAAQQSEMEQLMSTVPLDHLGGSTKSGHRKERLDNVKGRPPLLSLKVIDRHMMTVVHDSSLAPAVRDVNKLIHHPVVRDAVKQALGEEKNRVLNHWVRAVASNNKNNGVMMDAEERGLGIMQRGVTMMGLGANIAGAVMQVTGYLPLASRIGAHRAVRAMLRGMANPVETTNFVLSKSAFMREQLKGQDRDVRKMAEKWTMGGQKKLDAFRGATLGQYAFFQNMCNVPGWLECYNMGLKKFGDDRKAVLYADSVIRQTQGSGAITDLTRFETSGTWKKMFTMFYSWFRVMHNMNTEAFRRIRHEPGALHKVGIYLNQALFVLVLPRLIEGVLRGRGPEGDDEDESWTSWTVKETLLALAIAPVEAVPVARDVVGGVSYVSGYKGGYRFTPVAATLESVSNLLERAVGIGDKLLSGEEPEWDKVWRSTSDAIGYLAGLPTRQANKWLEAAYDAAENDENFMTEAVRIIRGAPPKKK